jgi:hypothetical protein
MAYVVSKTPSSRGGLGEERQKEIRATLHYESKRTQKSGWGERMIMRKSPGMEHWDSEKDSCPLRENLG